MAKKATPTKDDQSEASRSAEPSGTEAALPRESWPLKLMLLLLLVGTCVSIYLVQHTVRIGLDPDYQSACNLSATFNCDKVATSAWSKLAGIPISLFAVPTYLLMAWLLSLTLRAQAGGSRTPPEDRRAGALALYIVAAIGLSTVAYSLFLAYISTFKIGAYCLYCMALYVVNLGVTGLALWAGPRRPTRALSVSLHALADFEMPLLPAVGVLVITAGASWVGYDMFAESLEAEYKARIDALFADAGYADPGQGASNQVSSTTSNQVNPGRVNPPHGQPGHDHSAHSKRPSTPPVQASPEEGSSAATTRSPPPQGGPAGRVLPDYRKARRGGQRNDSGWSWFETPVDQDHEHWRGNPNATTTVVKFADFQCSYCRVLSKNLKPMHEKYGDDVRFVMKHFPMDPKCNPYTQTYFDHPNACEAAWASECAGRQGLFWEMHDVLYENQDFLDRKSLSRYARRAGLDVGAFDVCMEDPSVKAVISNDIEIARAAGINGTPKTYVGNRQIQGSAPTKIIEYYIKKALENPSTEPPGAAEDTATQAQPVAAAGPGTMVSALADAGAFFIDPYEAAISEDGRAASLPGVEPALASWFDAKASCEAAGKRLCTEEEWMSACTSMPVVDENGNGWFSDDQLAGSLYSYGDFYESGTCHDGLDRKAKVKNVLTGSKSRCRTPTGIYDLNGNVAEWVVARAGKPALMGGHATLGQGATCALRNSMSQAGSRNITTGFRCCSDENVKAQPAASSLKENIQVSVGEPVPEIDAPYSEGGAVELKGKVTLLNFFASWCAPCRKEFPYLVEYEKRYRDQGFQVVAIGTDADSKRSLDFAAPYGAEFDIVLDSESKLKGKFSVNGMPATFLIDRDGVIRFMETGFKPDTHAARLEREIKKLL